MKEIKVESIRIINFKGVTDAKIVLSERSEIMGANATGKTTVFDAFLWCLFGRDSDDRKGFSIKTYDANGKVIPKIPHEVTVNLLVDGEPVVLTRTYSEKWRDDKFLGHEEERIFNDIPLSVAEWKERLGGIISEDSFKYITNPFYFTSQKADLQREILFKMAGGVSNDEICAKDERFKGLLDKVGDTGLDDYIRALKARLARVVKAKAELPLRIDERRQNVVEEEDWDALNEEIMANAAELDAVNDALNDSVSQIKEKEKKRLALATKLSETKVAMVGRKATVEAEARWNYSTACADKRGLENSRDRELGEIEKLEEKRKQILKENEDYSLTLKSLREEYIKIKSETFKIDENNFVCPVCGRKYDGELLKQKRDEVIGNFNADISKRLAECSRRGREIRDKKNRGDDVLISYANEILRKKSVIKDLETQIDNFSLEEPNYVKILSEDTKYNDLEKECERIEQELEECGKGDDNSELREKARALNEKLKDLTNRMAKRDVIRVNEERIEELEKQLRTLSEEEIRLKGELDVVSDFCSTRSQMLSDKVNRMFSIVKFRLFDTLVNGEEVPTCVATVGGVPYPDINSAGKVLVGLDIIRAMQKYLDVKAPVFIDNAESITDYCGLLDGLGQVVEIRVTDDAAMVIKHVR